MQHVQKLKFPLKVVLILFVLNAFALNHLNAQTRYNDSISLVALYNATDGPNWKNDSINNWLTGKLDTWVGIELLKNRVSSINLTNNNLKGSIPSAFCNLPNLKYLYLDNNKLSGSIPVEFGNFSSMITVYLFNNMLVGPIPSSLKNLKKLKAILMYSNQFNFTDFVSSTILPDAFTVFYYSPQEKLPAPTLTNNGNEITLTVSDINPENKYVWFVNGDSIRNFNSSSYTFIPTERVEIFVKIMNNIYTILSGKLFQDLILETERIIIESPQHPVVFTVHNPAPVCEPLSVNLTTPEITEGSTEGLTFTYFTDPELTNELNPQEASSISVAGTYYIKSTDEKGSSISKPVEVTFYPKPTLLSHTDNVTCPGGNNGSIDLTVLTGKAPFSYSWSNGALTEDINNIIPGSYSVSVTDSNGCVVSENFNIEQTDLISPEVLTQDITVQLGASGSVSITALQVDNGSGDNCGIASMVVAPSGFDCSNIGDNPVTLTVTDAKGNVSTAPATVTVTDNTAPTAIAKNITVQLGASGSVSITALQVDNGSGDNCGIASMVVSPSGFDCSNIGDNPVTLTVTDAKGNVSTAPATVTVTDNTAPTAIAKNITVQLGASGSVSITALQVDNGSGDNCGIASMVVSPSGFDCSNIGDNPVTLTVTDAKGNVSTAPATVTVTDNTAPTAIAKNITVQLGASGSVSITALQVDNGSGDNCGIASMSVAPSGFDCSKVGTNTVTLTVTDVHGNITTAQAIVSVEDKIAPAIIAPSSITKTNQIRNCGGNGGGNGIPVDLGVPVVSDNCTVKKVTNDAPALFQIGLTVVTWTATDVNGNSSTATQNVTIIDDGGNNKLPVINSITSNSPVYVLNAANVTGQFTDDNLTKATWNWGDGSNSSGTISGQQIKGSHKYRETGMYDVTLTIMDSYGKTATKVYSYIVVFDPANGDVTGGGWIISEKGDYRLKSISEKANFGFVAQYDKQLNLKGNLTFQMNCAKFNVSSTKLDWLLVDNDQAIFKGKASVNNVQGYEFLVSVIDIDIHKTCGGSNNKDMLRLIVWNSRGDVIYDNQYGDQIDERATDQIGSGSIVIHSGKTKGNENYKSLDLTDSETGIISPELFANLKVYPNPASKELYIEIPERGEQSVSFEIVDVTGRIITREVNLELYGQNGWINLEPYTMKPGFYILRLKESAGTQSSMFRFMKE